ncbi:hypothetical protein QFZ77_007563 [Paenibacillus sp. V4I3]|uniref:hypothetical protein n=1 Tax=Paenibacillus sp. V4I3 TaxID=3042305 RepID=UPI002780DC93|nr:hypothetical protein [Paenibacillus sp. V4I3]MDQ0878839.1 hypothetical protein [Paenibacillus sp. V4I3]MDQ0878904.1 hypothetical protein [Paenibacillus sp. V4I3]
MQVFDTRQINNLLTGIGLACELEATSEMNRAFVKVQVINKQKFLNKIEPNSARFYLRKYEVASKYLDNDWDVTDDELFDSVHEVDIIGIKNLEIQLGKYLDDFRRLVSEWKCDNPL